MSFTIKKIISLIDLTSLNADDTDEKITALCKQAQTPLGNVAAVCVYPKFIPLAKALLAHTKIKLATVVNFPEGSDPIEQVLLDIDAAIDAGATEIDVVIPYQSLKINKKTPIAAFVAECKARCGKHTLKTILETGELAPHEITLASNSAIKGGADFLKTSTGKVPVNATLEATEIMLHSISESASNVGLKISGGIRTLPQAEQYLEQAVDFMGKSFIHAKTFRIGASSLLEQLLSAAAK